MSNDCRSIYIKEDEYIFRNLFGSVAFTEGIHYWEIVADARTEHELKIGVSSINTMEECAEYQNQLKQLEEKHALDMQYKRDSVMVAGSNTTRESSTANEGTHSRNNRNAQTPAMTQRFQNEIQLSFSDVHTGWAFFGIG